MDYSMELRPVRGAETYVVSNDGRIFSTIPRRNGKNLHGPFLNLIKLLKNHEGYLQIDLWRHGKKRYAHRALMESWAWVDGCESMQVNHKNGVKDDNRIENLEWVTRQGNIRHSVDVLGKRRGVNKKLTMEQVEQIRERFAQGERVIHLAKAFNVSRPTITNVIKNKKWAVPKKMTEDDVKVAIEMRKAGASISKISRHIGFTHTPVANKLRKAGVF